MCEWFSVCVCVCVCLCVFVPEQDRPSRERTRVPQYTRKQKFHVFVFKKMNKTTYYVRDMAKIAWDGA